MQNRPWSIWWDFIHLDNRIWGVVIETDHPKHGGELMRLPIGEVEDENGHVDSWVAGPFNALCDELISGRISINKWVKSPTLQIRGFHRHRGGSLIRKFELEKAVIAADI